MHQLKFKLSLATLMLIALPKSAVADDNARQTAPPLMARALRSFSFLFLLLINTPAFAADPLQTTLDSVDAEAAVFGNEAITRLAAYRKQVEAGAEVETLKLCEGYRRARGLAPLAYHGHGLVSLDESLGAWADIFRAGLAQPISGIFGLKGDYLEQNNINRLKFQSWFGSLHVLYLVHSWGFLQGAVHCLNTMDQGELNRFAAAIAVADYEASLVTEVGSTFATGEATLGALAKATSYVFFPLRYLMRVVRARITRTRVVFGTLVVVPIATDNLFQYLNNLQAARVAGFKVLKADGQVLDARARRGYLLALGLNIFNEELAVGAKDFPRFEAWAKANLTSELQLNYHRDLNDLATSTNPDDANYKIVLLAMVPIIDQIHVR